MAPRSAFETPDLGRDRTCVKILLRAYSWKCRHVTRDDHSPSCRTSAKGPQANWPHPAPKTSERDVRRAPCWFPVLALPQGETQGISTVCWYLSTSAPCKSSGSLSSKHAHNWAGDGFLPAPPATPDYCGVLDSFKKQLLRACFVPGTVLGPGVRRVRDTVPNGA